MTAVFAENESAMKQLLEQIKNNNCVVIYFINRYKNPPSVDCMGFIPRGLETKDIKKFILFTVPDKWMDIVSTTKWRDYFLSGGVVMCPSAVYQAKLSEFISGKGIFNNDSLEIIYPV